MKMDDFKVIIVFDDGTETIKKYFLTKTDMFTCYESMSKIYTFRSVSIGQRTIVCNVVDGGYDYVWDSGSKGSIEKIE